jgi:recombinational DNA repair ATPase RecF
MGVTIKALDIQAFRGIPELNLELDGKSLLLEGDNGTGKSSIVEAIEFFFTGKVSPLEGVQGLSLQRHGPHVKFKPEDVSTQITFDPGSISLVRTLASAPSPPTQLTGYFQVTQKGTFILRRSQILAFIISQPADRFRTIGSIIGIERLDGIELEMMRLRDDLKADISDREGKSAELIKELTKITGKKIAKVEDILPALNEFLQENGLPPIESLEEVKKHAQEMLKAIRQTEDTKRIGVLNAILELTKAPLIAEEVVGKLDGLNEKVKPLLKEHHIRLELSVVELLKSGRTIIEDGEMDICPLCEQEIDRDKLLVRIENRLKTLISLSDKASEVRTTSITIIKKMKDIIGNITSILTKIEAFVELTEEKGRLSDKTSFLNNFVDKIDAAKELKDEIPIQELNQQKDEINMAWSSIQTKCKQIRDATELTKAEEKVLEVVRLIEQARGKANELVKVNSELGACKKYYGLAERIYSIFSETKKAKIQEIYNSIQGGIRSFYSTLHPNEPHKNIELTVALGRRASTELKMESFGRGGEDPRALTSEGHLDSLGLCIFLAFVKKFNEGCPLIILDDVVTTIDTKHRENICKLLLKEFGDKQLIITTHDSVWYEQLCASQRAYGMGGNFKNMSIVDWNVDTGPKMSSYKPRWDRIQEKLNAGDKRGAGNEGRQYVEWLLKQICITTNAPVPIRNWQSGMVADLLPHAKKRVASLVKDESYKEKVSDAFTELERTTILGNLLSHDNPLIDEVSVPEVKEFCNRVHELHGVFLCPSCGYFVGYFQDLNILRCRNERCENPIEIKTK